MPRVQWRLVPAVRWMVQPCHMVQAKPSTPPAVLVVQAVPVLAKAVPVITGRCLARPVIQNRPVRLLTLVAVHCLGVALLPTALL